MPRPKRGLITLFWAARYGHEKVAKVLIDNGADVNTTDKDGITELKWACGAHRYFAAFSSVKIIF